MMKPKDLALLILLSMIWSPSFLLIKLSVQSFSPLTIVFIRASIAFFFFLIITLATKQYLFPYLRYWKRFLLLGLFGIVLPFFLIGYGEMSIQSSLAAVINGTVPIFTVILAHFFIDDEPITTKKTLGIMLGVIGIAIIFFPFGNIMAFDSIAALCILLASICYAIGMIISKKSLPLMPILVLPAGQTLFATLLVFPIFLFFDKPWMMQVEPSLTSVASLATLGIMSTGLAYTLYYVVIRKVGAGYLSFATLIFPVLGLLLGIIFLNESLPPQIYLGAVFIMIGLFLNTKKPQKKMS